MPWQFDWDHADQEWLLLSTDREKARWYIQLSSDVKAHEQPKASRKVWVKIDYSAVKIQKARESKSLFLVNCEAETYQVPTIVSYRPDGIFIAESAFPVSMIVPDTMAATVARRVCRQ